MKTRAYRIHIVCYACAFPGPVTRGDPPVSILPGSERTRMAVAVRWWLLNQYFSRLSMRDFSIRTRRRRRDSTCSRWLFARAEKKLCGHLRAAPIRERDGDGDAETCVCRSSKPVSFSFFGCALSILVCATHTYYAIYRVLGRSLKGHKAKGRRRRLGSQPSPAREWVFVCVLCACNCVYIYICMLLVYYVHTQVLQRISTLRGM